MSEAAAEICDSFNASAEGYDRLIGRYLATLGPAFADAAGVARGMRLLDVGCGPGGLTQELVGRVGAEAVSAIDPSPPFVQACRERNAGVDVREGVAERLPFEEDSFDGVLSSLVVGFMSDPEAGAREMARIARPGGFVAACFWDLKAMSSLRIFWTAARKIDSSITGEIARLGTGEGDLARLLRGAGLTNVEDGFLGATATYADFADWWSAFTLGIGPAGVYVKSLEDSHRDALRRACSKSFPEPDQPFALNARAWFARGTVTSPAA